MKNRILKWWFHLFWKYTSSVKKIKELEAKRYCDYLTENYSILEQVFVLKELHKNLIQYREDQIKNEEINIVLKQSNINLLKQNLDKLSNPL